MSNEDDHIRQYIVGKWIDYNSWRNRDYAERMTAYYDGEQTFTLGQSHHLRINNRVRPEREKPTFWNFMNWLTEEVKEDV